MLLQLAVANHYPIKNTQVITLIPVGQTGGETLLPCPVAPKKFALKNAAIFGVQKTVSFFDAMYMLTKALTAPASLDYEHIEDYSPLAGITLWLPDLTRPLTCQLAGNAPMIFLGKSEKNLVDLYLDRVTAWVRENMSVDVYEQTITIASTAQTIKHCPDDFAVFSQYRPDEIWFSDAGKDGRLKLIALSEYRLPKGATKESIWKAYREGRFCWPYPDMAKG